MSPPRPAPGEQALRVFCQLAGADGEGRTALLDALCEGDAGLRDQVQQLLAADSGSPEQFLEDTHVLEYFEAPLGAGAEGLSAGGSFAGYEVLGLIAEGGMGSVYRARQAHPEREVALKVLRPGLAHEDLLRRFEREVAVLGKLQHKGIAAIHAAGVEGGVPYFAMEFVRGAPLTEHAAARDRRGRLQLLRAVCDAVAHAHEQGVVHRDLKPANILVDAAGEPRVLDFGIARLTENNPAATLATSPGQILGTLAYMSPEQALGEVTAVDARADVYSLGVILYELLAGRRPLEVEQRPLPEALRIVGEVDPAPLGDIDPALKGDVETVVAKALEKEPSRRYPSVTALADDIDRLLDDRPISARPPSTLYQLRKFTRRHRALVGGVAATLVTLVVGIVVSVQYALDADQANRESRVRLYRTSLAAASDALRDGRVTVARELLDEAPPERRGFEHQHVTAQLDGAMAVLEGEWYAVDWHPDGRQLLVASPDTLMLWDIADQGRAAAWTLDVTANTQTTASPPMARIAAALSDDGAWLVAGVGRDLRIWNVDTRQPVGAISLEAEIDDLVFLADDPVVAVGAGRTVHWVDVAALSSRAPWNDFPDKVWTLTASPDGRWLAASTFDQLSLWDLGSGRPGPICDLSLDGQVGGGAWPRCHFDPRGDRVTVINRFWLQSFDLSTGQRVLDVRSENEYPAFVAHEPGSAALLAGFRPNGRLLALDRDSGAVRRAVLPGLRGQTHDLEAHSPSGRIAVSLGDDLQVIDTHTGVTRALGGHAERAHDLCFSPDGSLLASSNGGESPSLRVWDLEQRDAPGVRVLRGHTSYLYGLAFSADGAWLATGGWDRSVRLWDVTSGECLAVVPIDSRIVYGATFSADATRLLVCGQKADWLVDLVTGEVSPATARLGASFLLDASGSYDPGPLLDLSGRRDPVLIGKHSATSPERAAFLRDGAPWIVRRGAAPVELLSFAEVPDSEETRSEAVALGPDSRLCAVSDRDQRVRLWTTDDARPHAVLDGHTSTVYGMAFSPDGSRLAAGARDGTIRLWDLGDHEPVAVLRGHEGYVHQVAFSPDGRTLASVSGDQTARLWETRSRQELEQRAQQSRRQREAVRPRVLSLLADSDDPGQVLRRLSEEPGVTPDLLLAARTELLVAAFRGDR